MKLIFIVLFLVLAFWFIYISIKKLGFFQWLLNRKFMRSKHSKLIIFALKVYFLPLQGFLFRSSRTAKQSGAFFILSITYFVVFFLVPFGSFWLFDQSQMINQIKEHKYQYIEGTAIEFISTSGRVSSPPIVIIKDIDGNETRIQYSLKKSIEEMKGQYLEIHFVEGMLSNKQLVSLKHQENNVRAISEELDWRVREYNKLYEINMLLIIFVLIVPWIRLWKYGLVPFSAK